MGIEWKCPTSVNLEDDHEFIIKDTLFTSMRAYGQSGQYRLVFEQITKL